MDWDPLIPEDIFHTFEYGGSSENYSSTHWYHCQTTALSHTHTIHQVWRANKKRKKRILKEPSWQTIAVLIYHQLGWKAFLVNTKHSRPNLPMLRCTGFSQYVLFLQNFQGFNIETAEFKKTKKKPCTLTLNVSGELEHQTTEE